MDVEVDTIILQTLCGCQKLINRGVDKSMKYSDVVIEIEGSVVLFGDIEVSTRRYFQYKETTPAGALLFKEYKTEYL